MCYISGIINQNIFTMKKLTLLLLMLCIGFAAFSQSNNKPQSPGDHLRYAARVQAGGTMFIAAGFIMHTMYARDPDRYGGNFRLYGPSLAMLGVSFHTIAFAYINNAGVLLNKQLSVAATDSGIGLAYKF